MGYILVEEHDDWISSIIIGSMSLVLTLLICGLISFGSLGLATLFGNSSYVKISESEIISLQDSSSTSGKFFLGSGRVNGSMQYTFMTKNNSEMQMKHLSVDDAVLIYSKTPKAEVYEEFFDNKIVKFFFGDQPLSSEKYKLYVPEGTVKEDYSVDLK